MTTYRDLIAVINEKKFKAFPLISDAKEKCPFLSLFYSILLEVLSGIIRQEKIRGTQCINEEIKLSLLVNNIILYAESP